VLAESARTTRGLRMATAADRIVLLDRVADAVLAGCVSLEPPELFTVPPEYQRPDGTSVFTRPGEARYTHTQVLEAEARLLGATEDTAAPVARAVESVTSRPLIRTDGRAVHLAPDQVDAVTAIAMSGRRVDVLVGPAGTGKTTTLAALKTVWEQTHGRGTVLGLAPSATAAAELADALGVGCENTAKWLYESTGPGATLRAAYLQRLAIERTQASGVSGLGRLRTIDTAINTLRTESARWAMRSDQLIILDEASLAGTATLDALTAQATRAGAKVLLVGDHAQLSAVDAGGVFNLLAERGRPAVLTSLWRFTHRWEATATRGLRSGDTRVLDAYADRDRISSGAAEAMCEQAYTAWQADTEAGIPAILLAADAATVSALNTRAHNDRVTDGLVSASGVTTSDGTLIGVGDQVMTRANNRRLKVPGGYVRNGDLWHVTAIGADGSLTVTGLTRTGTHTGHSAGDERVDVVLPVDYVNAYVDLGYATTTHRAQGITVDHAHVLAAPGMVRENLYVAMTRGRHSNHVYVAVDDTDPTCDYLPDPHGAPGGREVLQTILATTGAERSATQMIADRQNQAESLKHLEPIRHTLLADATTGHWTTALPATGLTPDQVTAVLASPARGPLFTALDRGTAAGYPMTNVLRDLINSRPLDSADDPARDIAAVLHTRVDAWLHTKVADPRAIVGAGEHTDMSPGAAVTLAQVDELIAARLDTLTEHAIRTEPTWMGRLGPEPDDDAARAAWRTQVTAIAARHDYVEGPTPMPAPEPPRAVAPVLTRDANEWSRTL